VRLFRLVNSFARADFPAMVTAERLIRRFVRRPRVRSSISFPELPQLLHQLVPARYAYSKLLILNGFNPPLHRFIPTGRVQACSPRPT